MGSRTRAADLFWSRSEGRLRALWRLLITSSLALLGVAFLPRLAVVPITLLLLLTGQVPLSALGDGQEFVAAINLAFAEAPILVGVRALVALALVVFLFAGVARWLDHRPWRDYGPHGDAAWWRDLAFGALLGMALMGGIFVAECALGWVTIDGILANAQPELPFWQLMVSGIFAYVLVGVQEELLLRGYLIRNLSEGLPSARIGARAAVVIAYLSTSLLFGLLHAGNANATLVSTLSLALAGLFLGLGYVLTGELALPIGLHITWNYMQGYLFGFPVSGNASRVSLLATRQVGAPAWTGGAFGPEAGLTGVLAVLLGMLAIYGWVRLTRGNACVQGALARYTPRQSKAEASMGIGKDAGTRETAAAP